MININIKAAKISIGNVEVKQMQKLYDAINYASLKRYFSKNTSLCVCTNSEPQKL